MTSCLVAPFRLKVPTGVDAKKLAHIARAQTLLQQLRAKAEQARRGYYDAAGVRQGGLIAFIRQFWSVLEPEQPFVDGWPLWAMCEHLEAVSFGDITRLLINVPPGFMKPSSVDSMVLLSRGRVRLGDVVVGDWILTHKGRYRRVAAVHEQGELPLLEVTTEHGRTNKTAPDHPYLTTRGWVKAEELKPGDVLAAVTPIGDITEQLVSKEEARLLGYMVGDGSCTHAPSFTNADPYVLTDFAHCAELCGVKTRTKPISPSKSVGYKATILAVNGAGKWLASHDLCGKNSYQKRIPTAILNSNREIIANFIGAYWSCDGQIVVRHSGKRGSIYVANATTVSEGLAYDLQHALLRLGINARIRRQSRKQITKRQPGGIYKYFHVQTCSHEDTVLFLDLPGLCAHKNSKLAGLVRQRFVQGPLFEDKLLSVVPAGSGQCRCLTVEEDHSFTANDLAIHNSLMTDCFWPAWEWGPLNKAHLRYVAFSYSASLTERDNDRFRMLVSSPAYQRLYGPFKTRRAKVKEDMEDTFVGKTGGVGLRNKTITKVMNTRSGWKLASSVGGVGTGERGDRIIIDDPHNVIEAESEIVRTETVRWFRESISSRFNNLDTGALVLIMQRVHYDDVSGVALSDDFDYCQFIVPWNFDPSRWIRNGEVLKNAIGWTDPRLDAQDWYKNDGQPAWPERFSEDAIGRLKAEIGPYGFSSQYQQSPVSRGEAIFKREYWKLWESPDDKFPPFDLIIGSLDGAFTEKEENDPSAMTVWGVWTEETTGFVDERDTGIRHNYSVKSRRLMLIRAWRKHLQFSSKRIDPFHYDTDASYRQRTSQHWGLIEWVRDTCVRYKVDKLLIEAKASGISAAQEIQNRYGLQDFGIQLCPVKGDKVARALAVQPTFSQGLVYAPDLDWADMVIEEMEMFPKGKYDDLTDSTTQALKYLRDAGMAQTFEEERHGIVDHVTHRAVKKKRLYPV